MSNSLDISVIICTHNPRADFLKRVLAALETQTLCNSKWELLLIDNASDKPLAETVDLSWHPNSHCIREEKLGLTNARLCGIKVAQGSLLVFVDDDNVLDKNYLEVALEIGKEYPCLGAWGGQTLPGFEEDPPAWTKPYWTRVGVREFKSDQAQVLSIGSQLQLARACASVRKLQIDT